MRPVASRPPARATCKGLPPITPNIDYSFRWDGLDAYDRAIQGRVTATIKVIYVYEFNYYGASEDVRRPSFSQFGSDTEVFDGRYACGNRSRHDGHALLLRHPGRADDHAGDRLVGRAPDRRPRRLDALRPPRL